MLEDERMNTNELITKADLEGFRENLITEIRCIFEGKGRPLKKWLKSSEVIKLLRISPGKLQTMRKSGIISYTRIGGSLYYEPDDIQKMFDKNKVGS